MKRNYIVHRPTEDRAIRNIEKDYENIQKAIEKKRRVYKLMEEEFKRNRICR